MSFWKKLGKKLDRGLETMHLHSLKAQLHVGKVFRNPKKYFTDIGSGYKKDVMFGAHIWSDFKGGKWGSLVKEGVSDTGKALTIKRSVVAKQARIGETGGNAYSQAKAGDYAGATRTVGKNKDLGVVADAAKKAAPVVELAQRAAPVVRRVIEADIDTPSLDRVVDAAGVGAVRVASSLAVTVATPTAAGRGTNKTTREAKRSADRLAGAPADEAPGLDLTLTAPLPDDLLTRLWVAIVGGA